MTSSRWSGHESCRSCSPKASGSVWTSTLNTLILSGSRDLNMRAYLDFLRLKYAEKRIDLLILIGDVVIDFMSRNRNVLFRGTPAVFYTLTPRAAISPIRPV